MSDAEIVRLAEDARRVKNWKRWGPYLSERQWGTVREDYSANGNSWDYFPHAHARSRAYRWGEDGLLGITDRECRLCFALALWNGRDSILKERLFGVTNSQGNHGEDVKETYFFLDATPTASYLKSQYRYPQAAFPYEKLLAENARRTKNDPEFELIDTGALNGNRFFDVVAEYAKASPDDVLIKITVINRAAESADIAVLPTLWFRNTWSWGGKLGEGAWPKPSLRRDGAAALIADHVTLGQFRLTAGPAPGATSPEFIFTENETDSESTFGSPNHNRLVKDAFHHYVLRGDAVAVARDGPATKAAAVYRLRIPAGASVELRLRLTAENEVKPEPLGPAFDAVFTERIAEADAFFKEKIPHGMAPEERAVARQAYAGLLWSKQFYM
jgi:hypothetical protein